MMQMVQGLLEQGGVEPDRAAAALSSISYDNYRIQFSNDQKDPALAARY